MPRAAVPTFAAQRISPGRLLICFSHLRWNFVYQRPQHLLSRAARSHQVYFFEEPIFETGDEAPRLDLHPQACGVTVAVPILPEGTGEEEAIALQRAMVDELLPGDTASEATFWYYTPMALAFSDHLSPGLCVYDCMDELSAFRGASPRLRRLERTLFNRADLVFTGGQSLYEAKRNRHHSVHAFPSSIDKAHFVQAREARRNGAVEPVDQAGIGGPRLGFFGVIDERMDVELVGAMARLRPDWHFVMIGPVVKIDPAILPRHANLHWLGGKSYDELPTYLSGWDVGVMPFALNESTRFISPTKTPEFLAAGVPVVSTAITDVMRPYGENGLVEIARGPEDFVRKAGALITRPKETWLRQVDSHLASTSWDKTWGAMDALMQSARQGRPAVRMPAAAAATTGALHV